MLLGSTYVYSIYGGNTPTVYIFFAVLFCYAFAFSVLFCQTTKSVLEHIKSEAGAKILRVTEKKGEGRRWVGLAFHFLLKVNIFSLLIVCLLIGV